MKLYTQKQVNEIMVLLQQSFLPENIECDGAHCMGCWKDVVRETLKKMANLTPIELPSDEEIDAIANDIGHNYFVMQRNHYEGLIEGSRRMAYLLIERFKQQDNDKI